VLFGVVPVSGGVLVGVLGADGFVALGFVEFGTVLGVADGEFGAAVGSFGAAVGVFGAVLGVTSGVAPGSVCMVVELGLVEAGGLVAFVVLGDCCGLIVLGELGLLEWAVPRAAPALDPVLDWA
jgi:hypothetical protein